LVDQTGICGPATSFRGNEKKIIIRLLKQNHNYHTHYLFFIELCPCLKYSLPCFNKTRILRIEPISADLILGNPKILKSGKIRFGKWYLTIWYCASITPRCIAGLRCMSLFTFYFYLFTSLSFELYPWPTGFVLVYSILKTSSQNTSQSLPSSVWFVRRVLNKAVHPKL